MTRTPIPDKTKQLVLMECGYMCGNPRCRHILTLELHHIVWVKNGGENLPENLIALCPNCHSLHTYGKIPSDAINYWKSLLLSLNNANRMNYDVIIFMFNWLKSEDKKLRIAGDGLLQISGMINSGLIKISKTGFTGGHFGGGSHFYEIELTEKGQALMTDKNIIETENV